MTGTNPPLGFANHGAAHLSAAEHYAGYAWIDGKPVFRKVINYGALNAGMGTKNVAHSITGVDTWIRAAGVFADSSNKTIAKDDDMSVDATNVGITTPVDQSENSGFVILEYTKT